MKKGAVPRLRGHDNAVSCYSIDAIIGALSPMTVQPTVATGGIGPQLPVLSR